MGRRRRFEPRSATRPAQCASGRMSVSPTVLRSEALRNRPVSALATSLEEPVDRRHPADRGARVRPTTRKPITMAYSVAPWPSSRLRPEYELAQLERNPLEHSLPPI